MNEMEQAGIEMKEAFLRLDHAVEVANETLRKLSCPFEVELEFNDSESEQCKYLLWTKYKGKFRICLASADHTYVALDECGTIYKLLVLQHFKLLLDKVVEKTREAAKTIRERTEQFIAENHL